MYSLNNTKMTVTTYMESPWNIRYYFWSGMRNYFPSLYLIKSDVTHWHFKRKSTISVREMTKVLSIKKCNERRAQFNNLTKK